MRGPTITEAAELYLEARLARGEITVASAGKIRIAVRQLTRACGDKPLRKFTKADAEAWLAHTQSIGNKASTRRLRWSYLNVFCEWLVDEELLARNPFRNVKPPKPPRRAPRVLNREQVGRLLAACPTLRDELIVMLMVQEGLRCEGVSSLRVEDIDHQRRELRVVEKFGHERTLHVTDECWELLSRFLEKWPASEGPLIRAWSPHCNNQTGTPRASGRPLTPGVISKFVVSWMWEAGIKRARRDGFSAHALRRTCATDMVENGADLVVVRDVLGHTSIATTNNYLGVAAGGRIRTAMDGRRYLPAGPSLGVDEPGFGDDGVDRSTGGIVGVG